MTSQINSAVPADGEPAVKAELRANLQAAKSEIEALQARQVPPGGLAGQVLKKTTASDFGFAWADDEVSAGGGITAFPGVAFASDYLVVDSPADQAAALDSFFDQARIAGKHLLFDQGATTYYTSKCHFFGSWEFADEGGQNRPGIANCIIDFGGCTLKKHSSASLGTQFERRGVMKIHGGHHLVFRNGRISGNRDVVTAGNNEFKPSFWLGNGPHHVWFENMEFGECWGDGLELDGLYGANSNEDNWPRHIWMTNCVFDRAGRNGLTVNQGKHIRCINCVFRNTAGHSPEAGCDLESYSDSETRGSGATYRRDIYDVVFIGCRFEGNNRPGLIIASIDQTPNGILCVHDVKVLGCTFRNNGLSESHNHIVCRGFGVIIDGCTFEDLNASLTSAHTSCIWFNHFSRELYSDIRVSNCRFKDNPAAEALITIGRQGSSGVNDVPVVVDGCTLDGSSMAGDFPLVRVDVGKAIVRNCYLKGRGAGSTSSGIVVTSPTWCVISGIDAENMTTIVTNGSGNLKRADFLTRLAGVTNTLTGTAPAVAPTGNG